MNILLHAGVGNHDRPERWDGICLLYTYLAKSLESLGHNVVLYVHSKALREDVFYRHWTDTEVNLTTAQVDYFDCCFTWNGSSEGDKKIIEMFGRDKCVFGELGFFNHYSTVYFDFSGTNCKSQNLIDYIGEYSYYKPVPKRFYHLQYESRKPRLQEGRYVFVALQDEQDTQITMYSPFKKMNDLIQYVSDLTACYGDDIKILYKKHPMAPCEITCTDPRLIEVKEDVHHYLEDAELVIGCNSTVLFECLLYHNRIITCGLGLSTRLVDEDSRAAYVMHCYNKQIDQNELADPNVIKETWMYKQLMEKYNENNN